MDEKKAVFDEKEQMRINSEKLNTLRNNVTIFVFEYISPKADNAEGIRVNFIRISDLDNELFDYQKIIPASDIFSEYKKRYFETTFYKEMISSREMLERVRSFILVSREIEQYKDMLKDPQYENEYSEINEKLELAKQKQEEYNIRYTTREYETEADKKES